jgi:hypothetical protein
VRLFNVHSSPYDVSYDPTNYARPIPALGRDRSAGSARRISSPGEFMLQRHLPFYDGANQGSAFCYSTTANAFNNGENPVFGP